MLILTEKPKTIILQENQRVITTIENRSFPIFQSKDSVTSRLKHWARIFVFANLKQDVVMMVPVELQDGRKGLLIVDPPKESL